MLPRSGSVPTFRQLLVLRFIDSMLREQGMSPSLREIAKHIGIVSTNGVNDHLRALERKGLIVREQMTSRSASLTPDGRAALTAHHPAPVRYCKACGRVS